MNPDSLLALLLPVASVLLAAWLCLPELLMLLRGIRIQNGFTEGPEEVTRWWLHDLDEDLCRQVAGLGFQPVGIYWEKTPLGRLFHEFVFASPEDPGFAMLYPNKQILPRRATFMTVFTSGAVVFTKNYQGGVEVEEDDFLAGLAGQPLPPPPTEAQPEARRQSGSAFLFHLALGVVVGLLSFVEFENQALAWTILGGGVVLVLAIWMCFQAPQEKPVPRLGLDHRSPLEEVLHEHRLRVAHFLRMGHVPVPGNGQESFLEVQRLYHQHHVVRRQFLSSLQGILWAKLVFFALVPGLLVSYLGLAHPAPWACLLAEGLAMAAVRLGLSSAAVIKLLYLGGKSSRPSEAADKKS